MKAAFLLMTVCLVSLTGCEINRVGGKFAGVDIEAKSADGGSRYSESKSYCPYGQAKKGRCH